MTWLALLRRAWAVWKLHRRTFGECVFCHTACEDKNEYRTVDNRGRPTSWECMDCQEARKAEQAKANNGIPTLFQRQIPGLQALFGTGQSLGQAGLQQYRPTQDQQRWMMEAQMNMSIDARIGTDMIRNLLGSHNHPPKKQ